MRIQELLVDPEFAIVQQEVMRYGTALNVASANEHVSGIERKTRVLKERVRGSWSNLPYKKLPLVMIVELVKDVVAWLNQFPSKGCVLGHVGPRAYITGQVFDYRLHWRAEFG